jgi:hypothetical protein
MTLKKSGTLASLSLITLLLLIGIDTTQNNTFPITTPQLEKEEEGNLAERVEQKKARDEYFFELMRDPATNRIPEGIRQKEIAHAKNLPLHFKGKRKASQTFNWKALGPNDVGGRTRALAVDMDNNNIILAGGVSGGVWRSTNQGETWTQVTTADQNPSVTSIAQDPRAGHRDTWYYVTGEYSGNSAGARGGGATYYGSGIYKSTDNGLTWTMLASAGDLTRFDSRYDFVSRVAVSPTTGTVFFASNAIGIYRSDDGGATFDLVLGEVNEHSWSDVQINANGVVIATLSETGFLDEGVSHTNSPGIYRSNDDGLTWTDITTNEFPTTFSRTRIAISESDPNSVYVFGYDGSPFLIYTDLSDLTKTENRSANIPDFGGSVGSMNMQGGYNLEIAVDPNNKDFVVIGGTNMFRSFDGFKTKPSEAENDRNLTWVGGYSTANNVSTYEGHHPDNHAIVFDPVLSNKVWSGHDGGVSVTNSIKRSTVQWTHKVNGYNVTQFYTVAIPRIAGDDRYIGGTQDNGSPFFRDNIISGITGSNDISSGDGSYAYIGKDYGYTSSQRGNVIRILYRPNGDMFSPYRESGQWSFIEPEGSTNQKFIHPFKIDPSDEDIMYYPESNHIWRNDSLSHIPNYEQGGTSVGWAELFNINVGTAGHSISTLEVSTNNPSHRLYLGGSSSTLKPTLYRIDNANTATSGGVDISPPDAAAGAYIHDIAVNATDGDELIAVLSNYAIESLYHSSDAGATWTAIGGNLEGAEGPSVRTAAIIEGSAGTVYLVGTSTGLYSTTTLDGSNTIWEREDPNGIGLNVVEFIDSRPEDNRVAVATHGRGMWAGTPGSAVSTEEEVTESVIPESFALNQNYPNPFNPSTVISYSLPSSSNVNITVYDINGRKVAELLRNEMKSAGSHEFNFDASNLASGVYLYRISAKSISGSQLFTKSRKMTLIK